MKSHAAPFTIVVESDGTRGFLITARPHRCELKEDSSRDSALEECTLSSFCAWEIGRSVAAAHMQHTQE
eukprot:6174073-Pleurochrysis_carterae.AAC.1